MRALSRICSAMSFATSGFAVRAASRCLMTAWRGLSCSSTRGGVSPAPSVFMAFIRRRMCGDMNLSALSARAGESTSRSLVFTSATRSPSVSLTQATSVLVCSSVRAPSAGGFGRSSSFTSAWSAASRRLPSNSCTFVITYSSTFS